MTSNWALAGAALVACGLWALVALTGDGSAPAKTERVAISELGRGGASGAPIESIELRSGGGAMVLDSRDGQFYVGKAAAKPETTAQIIATLGYGYSRRFAVGEGRDPDKGLGDGGSATLTIRAGERTIELRRGAPTAGGKLVWIGRGDDALLITKTEADLLFPALDGVLDRRLFRLGDAAITKLVVKRASGLSLVLSGSPLAVGGRGAIVDRDALASLIEPLRDATLREAAPPSTATAGVFVELSAGDRASQLRVVGDCGGDGGYLVDAVLGSACVGADASRAVDALNRLIDDPSPVLSGLLDFSRRPIRAVMDLGGRRVEVDLVGVGREAARAWLSPLASARAVSTDLGGKRLATIDVEFADGASDLIEIFRNGATYRAQKKGGATAKQLDSAAAAELLGARAFMFRSLSLSARDPGEISKVLVGGRSLSPSELPDEVTAVLSHLVARRFVSEKARALHGLSGRPTVTVRFHPPPIQTSDPSELSIELGKDTRSGDGCYARLAPDPVVFVLAADACSAIRAL